MIDLKKLIPLPKHIEQNDNIFKAAQFGGSISVNSEKQSDMIAEGIKIIEQKLFDAACVKNSASDNLHKIIIKVDPSDDSFDDIKSDEAYTIKTAKNETVLCGKSESGAFYACVTLSEMFYVDDADLMLPEAYIKDYPDFPCRGHYLECRFGTELMTLDDWYEAIDYTAKQKCNYLGIGIYGCWRKQYDEKACEYLYIPLEKYPDIRTEKTVKYYSVLNKKWVYAEKVLPPMYEQDFFSEIINYAKNKNITVFPTFNSLGHNTLLPKSFPEIASKDENGNSKTTGFCTNNEKTYEIMFSIYDNIIDKYLLPNGIDRMAIGLDEVGEAYRCRCADCRKTTFSEQMVKYIIRICKYIKSKGIKHIYLYHDMLYNEFNIVNEDLKKRFKEAGIYDEVILQWWSYEDPLHLFWDKSDGVNGIFHSIIKPYTGYYSWCIPTEHCENIRACAKLAKERGFEGVMAYGSFDLCFDKNFLTLSEVSWNTDTINEEEDFNRRYAIRTYPQKPHAAINAFHSIADVMKDDSRTNYMNRLLRFFEYYFYSYRNPQEPVHKNYPGEAFRLIVEKKDVYIPYLEFVKQKSSDALSFFDSVYTNDKIGMNWLLTSRQYYVDADEFLSLYNLWELYNKGDVSEFCVIEELERLIVQRENLMSFAETVKFKPASYAYLRNMSVVRQFLTDLCNYFKKESGKGNRPKLDIADLSYVNGKTFDFLR